MDYTPIYESTIPVLSIKRLIRQSLAKLCQLLPELYLERDFELVL